MKTVFCLAAVAIIGVFLFSETSCAPIVPDISIENQTIIDSNTTLDQGSLQSSNTTDLDNQTASIGQDVTPALTGQDIAPALTGQENQTSSDQVIPSASVGPDNQTAPADVLPDSTDNQTVSTGQDVLSSTTGQDNQTVSAGQDVPLTSTGQDNQTVSTGQDIPVNTTGQDNQTVTTGQDVPVSTTGQDNQTLSTAQDIPQVPTGIDNQTATTNEENQASTNQTVPTDEENQSSSNQTVPTDEENQASTTQTPSTGEESSTDTENQAPTEQSNTTAQDTESQANAEGQACPVLPTRYEQNQLIIDSGDCEIVVEVEEGGKKTTANYRPAAKFAQVLGTTSPVTVPTVPKQSIAICPDLPAELVGQTLTIILQSGNGNCAVEINPEKASAETGEAEESQKLSKMIPTASIRPKIGEPQPL